jgi:hypothetical protein
LFPKYAIPSNEIYQPNSAYRATCASLLKHTTSGAECAEEEIVTVTSRLKRELEEADTLNFGSGDEDDAIAILLATQFLLPARRFGLRTCNHFV